MLNGDKTLNLNMIMKKNILYFLAVSLTVLAGCQDPEYVLSTSKDQGITRLVVKFTTGDYAEKTAVEYTISDASADAYVIPIPWFYPESSDNETTEYMSAMKVEANLTNNYSIQPILGILDLTKDNYFTLADPDGGKRKISIRGERTKSDACSLLAFSITDPALTGIIDQDKQTISIISLDDLSSCLVNYTLSAHATISPDPAVTPINYNNPVEFTVMAHNGTSKKVYTVQKEIPLKIGFGFRSGSQVSLYALDVSTLGFPAVSVNTAPSLAVIGNSLVLNFGDGSTPIYLNKTTGAKQGNITLGSASAAGCVASDVHGTMLICNHANSGENFKVYKTKSATASPTLFYSYANTSGYPIGSKVSIQGDLDGNAIIVATCEGISGVSSSSSFVRWIVSGGVIGQPEVVTANGVSAWGGIDNTPKLAYRSTNISDGYFLGHYDGGNDNVYFVNSNTNSPVSYLTGQSDGSGWGMGNGILDVKEFNSARYMVLYSVAYFPMWGMPSGIYMYDVTSTSMFTNAAVDNSQALAFKNSSVTSFDGGSAPGDSRTGDVLLYPSSDGYKLNLYYIDNTNRVVGCYEFDCIDK